MITTNWWRLTRFTKHTQHIATSAVPGNLYPRCYDSLAEGENISKQSVSFTMQMQGRSTKSWPNIEIHESGFRFKITLFERILNPNSLFLGKKGSFRGSLNRDSGSKSHFLKESWILNHEKFWIGPALDEICWQFAILQFKGFSGFGKLADK